MGFQIVAPTPSLRPLTPDLFSDITTSPYAIDTTHGVNRLMFADDLTPLEQLQVTWRATRTPEMETLLRQALVAVANNRNFRDTIAPQLLSGADAIIAAPGSSTQEKQLAQGIKSLTNQLSDTSQQNNALIQLALDFIE